MKILAFGCLAALLVLGTSCGEGDDAADCNTVCGKQAAAHCASSDVNTCLQHCSQTNTQYGSCAAFSAYMSCAANTGTFACDSTGAAKLSGCDTEYQAMQGCADGGTDVCTAASGDDACASCKKQACCESLREIYSASDASVFLSCSKGCSDADCVNQCEANAPNAGAAYNGLLQCVATNCQTQCPQ